MFATEDNLKNKYPHYYMYTQEGRSVIIASSSSSIEVKHLRLSAAIERLLDEDEDILTVIPPGKAKYQPVRIKLNSIQGYFNMRREALEDQSLEMFLLGNVMCYTLAGLDSNDGWNSNFVQTQCEPVLLAVWDLMFPDTAQFGNTVKGIIQIWKSTKNPRLVLDIQAVK